MSTHPTFKRNQVEWALWRLFASGSIEQANMPAVFRNRIKRLLDLDRDMEHFEESGSRTQRYALFDEEPQGRGHETRFSRFDVFALASALELLDAGCNLADIIFLLRHVRVELEHIYNIIQLNPPWLGDNMDPEDRPNAPTRTVKGHHVADCRVFMLLEKVELTKTIAHPKQKSRYQLPVLIQPKFFRGIEELNKEIDQMGVDFRKLILLELAEMAVMLNELLVKAPERLRGR